MEKIRTLRDRKGRYLYFPWKEPNYVYPNTTDNVVKMWHSIQSVFELMMQQSALTESDEQVSTYSRVAMIRSDVMYLSPLDIYYVPPNFNDTQLRPQQASLLGGTAGIDRLILVPGFGKYPVSDRAIVGPADAVRLWATKRFARLDAHVRSLDRRGQQGFGMHSERFVGWTLLPALRRRGYAVLEHDTWCFCRARTDETVWISDCHKSSLRSVQKSVGESLEEVKATVEGILHRPCRGIERFPPDAASVAMQTTCRASWTA